MPTTSTYGWRYPSSGDAPNIPQDIQNLANDIEDDLEGSWANLTLYSGYTSFGTGYTAPSYRVSAGIVHLRGMVRRSGADLAVGLGIRRAFAAAPAAIRTALAVSPLAYAAFGAGQESYPVRVHYAGAGGGDLDIIGMNSGTGTLTSGTGFINLDGVSWFL